VAVGVKVTLTVQFPAAASVAPQVVVFEKSPAFAPRIATCHRLIVELPRLVSVTGWAVLGVPTVCPENIRLGLERLSDVPNPARTIFWGLPGALSPMLMYALRGPMAVGWKVVRIRQLDP
jgi:hypothetical protein